MVADGVATGIIIACGIIGLIFAAIQAVQVAKIKVEASDGNEPDDTLMEKGISQHTADKLNEIALAIQEGAQSFLTAEYTYLLVFIIVFGLFLGFVIGADENGLFSAISFAIGGLTSILCGFIGMRIAVYANVRTAVQANKGFAPAFNTAFRAGTVMGFALVSIALLILFILINLFDLHFDDKKKLYDNIAGYGLGGSSIALFGRVGGGIYTKAADVGADLVGKIEAGIPEDDPRNPAVIADNVGDNVGDIAGMGADLFGSFAESTCATLVIAASSEELSKSWAAMMFPLVISALGIIVGIVTSFVATNLILVRKENDIEPSLKRQLVVSTVLMTPVLYLLSVHFLPAHFHIGDKKVEAWHAFFCVASGLWAGLLIGYITEYYTSHAYKPVRDVANSCVTGAATNVIYGLALGYLSVIIPVLALTVAIFTSWSLAGMYGIALAALGMLCTLTTGLTIDAYGPISDNAGGIAEMAELGPHVRERTDALDAAGNTTAAIGKGFAIGSASLVSLALFGAFVTRAGDKIVAVDVLNPFVFAGLLIGAMLPYAFSAMTMKSVGQAALAMVHEVRRQFQTIPGIMDGTGRPDYKRCVKISTESSLKQMIGPGLLVMLTPIVVGFFFGVHAVCGLLAGGLVSGVQMAISSSNTGGAWDNAKKFIEKGNHGGKGSDAHKAAVIGDTVGDPLKDTSGPSLNILMKLMAILSLVFAPLFIHHGGVIGKHINKGFDY